MEEQADQPVEKYKGRRRHTGQHLQKNVSNRSWFSQVLWAAKDPQENIFLRHIVSSRGTVTYGLAGELARILRPLIGKF